MALPSWNLFFVYDTDIIGIAGFIGKLVSKSELLSPQWYLLAMTANLSFCLKELPISSTVQSYPLTQEMLWDGFGPICEKIIRSTSFPVSAYHKSLELGLTSIPLGALSAASQALWLSPA
jgi:hypothetical protein